MQELLSLESATKMENHRLKETYENKNPITLIYFRTKAWLAVKMAGLKKQDVILDFGCGGGWLEKKLKNYEIYGYDINPEKTFIKDYKKIKPDKIFALDVFEHIPEGEIRKILDRFKKLKNKFWLIVTVPTENLLSRKVRKFVGKTEIPKEHITNHKKIFKILKENFKLKKKINFFSVSKIFVFEH
jgi:SAM-dependent methyltransferase